MSSFAYLKYEKEYGVPQIESASDADSAQEIKEFDHSAVDFDQLQRFTLGNRSLEKEVLTLFRTQSVLYIERLRSACDDLAWLEAAHTLKGSAAGIGAHGVRQAAMECERLTGEERARNGEAALRHLQDRLDEADMLIAAFLND